jgi:hypothetical protein
MASGVLSFAEERLDIMRLITITVVYGVHIRKGEAR